MKTYLKSLKLIFVLFGLMLLGIGCENTSRKIYTGLDCLEKNSFSELNERRVGLITNQTGLNQHGIQNVDLFLASPHVNLKAVFSPEHGFEGKVKAGEKIMSERESNSGIRFYSLYGKTRKPTPKMLRDIDVLVFDIQDIGLRSYTYMSTMGLAMEAAGEQGIDFIVLDRPNPLGGQKIDGNILDQRFSSFIGMYPIPYVHGLTPGELATLINESKWMNSMCKLSVIKLGNWKRNMSWKDTKLNWIPPSPNVPKSTTPIFMVATGIMGELGIFSIGIGTDFPFELMGAPWIQKDQFIEKMNQLNLPGVSFDPVTFSPTKGLFKGEEVQGVHIKITDLERAELIKIQFHFMEIHQQLYPDKNPFELTTPNQLSMFNKALGTDQILEVFSKKFKVEDIARFLTPDLSNFRKMSKTFYLYE